jgi:hypothetical protein
MHRSITEGPAVEHTLASSVGRTMGGSGGEHATVLSIIVDDKHV